MVIQDKPAPLDLALLFDENHKLTRRVVALEEALSWERIQNEKHRRTIRQMQVKIEKYKRWLKSNKEKKALPDRMTVDTVVINGIAYRMTPW